MNKFADKKEQVEAEFKSFMEQSIWNCARNVTRKMTAEESRNSGVPIETLNLKRATGGMVAESADPQEDGVILEIKNLRITINSDVLRTLLDGLSEREKQTLILHVGFGFNYEEIGRMLGISPDRAKAYKYHGLRKAREKNGGKGKQD